MKEWEINVKRDLERETEKELEFIGEKYKEREREWNENYIYIYIYIDRYIYVGILCFESEVFNFLFSNFSFK